MNIEKAAVFSDIHSNYYAFLSCFEDAKKRGAQGFIFLGDYVSDLSETRKTLDLLYEINAAYPCWFLRGNRERYMLDAYKRNLSFLRGPKTGSLLYTYEQLNRQDFEFFESLPIYDTLQIYGASFEIAHSTKNNDRYYFEKNDGRIRNVFRQMHTGCLITGHSHKQYSVCNQGKTIINPGSIGVPRGYGGLTQYAMLEFENERPEHTFYQVPYDVEKVIIQQFESGLVAHASCWAIGVLYDVITGEEYTMTILDRVLEIAGGDERKINDDLLWRDFARHMGMSFTEKEIIEFYRCRKTYM